MTLCDAMDGVTALLVEDDPFVREALRGFFESCGILTTATRSAAEAIASLDAREFDIIVSDIVMPDVDGIELIREVRRRPRDRAGDIPALALSADADPARRTQAFEAGFQAYLIKPLRPQYIIAVMADLLLGSRRPPRV